MQVIVADVAEDRRKLRGLPHPDAFGGSAAAARAGGGSASGATLRLISPHRTAAPSASLSQHSRHRASLVRLSTLDKARRARVGYGDNELLAIVRCESLGMKLPRLRHEEAGRRIRS